MILHTRDCYVMCAEDETGDKLVSVQLDDEESWLNFIDVPGSEVVLFNFSVADAFASRIKTF